MPNNVQRLREQKGLTQERFAELCGISRASIARYEAGEEINRKNAVKIADACEVTVDFVLGIDTETPTGPDDLAWVIRERLRRDPTYRLLFDAADNATPEHLRAAVAVLQALDPNEGQEDKEPL